MSAPLITAVTMDVGNRTVQLWDENYRIAGLTRPACMAEMTTIGTQMLSINIDCLTPWIDIALGLFASFRRGELPTSTHEITWVFGRPTFTPITPDPQDSDVLFDMEGRDR